MSREPRGIDVTILDRTLRVACSEEEEPALREAVAYLDARMREIRDSGKAAGHDRIAIMAALNIAHELLSLQLPNGFDIGTFKRRMKSMSATIDEAISAQDQLF